MTQPLLSTMPGAGPAGHLSAAPEAPVPALKPLPTHDQVFLHLDDRGYVPFHPVLADQFGHKAAIFVGMALYWTRHSLRHHPARQGWFFMSMEQWQSAIGLTRREQASVRAALVASGVLEEMLIGRPAVMNYRINLAALTRVLLGPGAFKSSWDVVHSWFRECVNYYKPLADVVGSISAGLYLSMILQRQRDALLQGQLNAGCLRISQEDVAQALRLGSKVQRNARDRLKRSGLIQESGTGGSLVRINLDAVLACLRGQNIKVLPGRKPAVSAEVAVADTVARAPTAPIVAFQMSFGQMALQFRVAPQASTTERAKDFLLDILDVTSGTDQPVGNRQVGTGHGSSSLWASASKNTCSINNLQTTPGADPIAETCKLTPEVSAETCNLELPKRATYIQGSFSLTTTTASAPAHVHAHEAAPPIECRRRDDDRDAGEEDPAQAGLILPHSLDSALVPGVLHVLRRADRQQWQALLDELEGNLSTPGKRIGNPAGWLYGLIQAMQAGPVVLALSTQVAESRRLKQAAELRLAQAMCNTTAPSANYSLPRNPEIAKAHLAELRQMVGLRAKGLKNEGSDAANE